MAETLDIEAPVFRGLREFQSFTVAVASGADFDAYEFVQISSGEATDYTADADNLAVAGREASEDEAPSGSPNTGVVNVFRLHDQVTVEMNLTGTYAQTDIGTDYGLAEDGTTGHMTVDRTDTSATRVRVMQRVKGEVGDDNVRVLVRVLPANAF